MALQRLPYYEDWDKSLAKYKLKKDNGVRKALEDFWKLDADEYDKRLAQLPKLLKLATDFKKAKEVVAAGSDAVKMVGELVDVIPTVRKQVEQDKKEFLCNGAHPIDVQFIVMDWNGKNFAFAKGWATFTSPSVPKVVKAGPVSPNGFDIRGVKLAPSGTVNLMIQPGGVGDFIEGTTDYDFKPGQRVMKFKAVQKVKTHKTKSKTIDNVIKKLGLKGTVGAEWNVLKVDGEQSNESDYTKGFEDEVEWVIEQGIPAFEDFKKL
jgi:hypothetical protein